MTTWLQTPPELGDRDLAVIVRLVYEKSGITLHPGKRALVIARLQRRLKLGGFESFKAYVQHLKTDRTGTEVAAMLDAIATNHTSFFREPEHFQLLAETVLPSLRARRTSLPILGWTAACSTGEEAYTLAIVSAQLFGGEAGHRIRLLASDLSSKALKQAASGEFKADRIAQIPRHLALKYFVKLAAPRAGTLQVVDSIRRMVEFRRVNLIALPPPGQPFDFIFCRNVMIYFDRSVQQRVIQGLEERLAPGGYLFTSHSESLNGLRHGLTWVAPSVYRKAAR